MNFEELNNYLISLPDQILSNAAEITAETATEYYKGSFTRKAFDGNPWMAAKAPRKSGSLLVNSGNLLNSIRPWYIGPDKVVIAAGNDKVSYAKAHNEGFRGSVSVPAHTRNFRGNNVPVKAYSKTIAIPQRQFVGESNELANEIHKRLQGYIDNIK